MHIRVSFYKFYKFKSKISQHFLCTHKAGNPHGSSNYEHKRLKPANIHMFTLRLV